MKKDLALSLALWTVLSALMYLGLLHLVLHNWIDPDTSLFRTDRMILLPVVPGLLMLLVELVLHTTAIYQHRSSALRNNEPVAKWYWVLLLLSGGMFAACLGFDLLYFTLVDDNLPKAFAETVAQISLQSGRIPDDQVLQSFAQLPLFAQNVFLNLITILLGNALALLVGRKLAKPLVPDLT